MSHDDTQNTNTFKMFEVTIGNSKCVENFKFHYNAPMLKYCHNSFNSSCIRSLASAFFSIKKLRLPILYHCENNNP